MNRTSNATETIYNGIVFNISDIVETMLSSKKREVLIKDFDGKDVNASMYLHRDCICIRKSYSKESIIIKLVDFLQISKFLDIGQICCDNIAWKANNIGSLPISNSSYWMGTNLKKVGNECFKVIY